MTSPSSGIVSADAAYQIQAGKDLRMHSDGYISDMNRLRNQTQNLPTGLQGGTLTAAMAQHEAHYTDAIRNAQRLGGHGDHYVASANANMAADQDGQQLMARSAAPSTSSVSSINM